MFHLFSCFGILLLQLHVIVQVSININPLINFGAHIKKVELSQTQYLQGRKNPCLFSIEYINT